MTVRPAALGDLDPILRLAAATPEAPRWPRSVYKGFLDGAVADKRIFLAEEEGGVTGFTAGHIAAELCELESIVVDSTHRRAGIGKALLMALAEWARHRGAAKVLLEVRAGNDAAIRLYESAEFHRDGLRHRYYRHPEEDALLMSLTLPPVPDRSSKIRPKAPNSARQSFPPRTD